MMYLTWYLVFVEAPFRQPEKFTLKFAYSTFWSLIILRDIKFYCFLMARQLQQHLIFIVSNYVTTVFGICCDNIIFEIPVLCFSYVIWIRLVNAPLYSYLMVISTFGISFMLLGHILVESWLFFNSNFLIMVIINLLQRIQMLSLSFIEIIIIYTVTLCIIVVIRNSIISYSGYIIIVECFVPPRRRYQCCVRHE